MPPIETIEGFEELSQAFSRLHEDRIMLTPKKKKQENLKKLFNELSDKNLTIFDEVKKIQTEIDKIEGERLTVMAEKYDRLLFVLIGKDYTLKGLPDNKKSTYINTLKQTLFNLLDEIINKNNLNLEEFTKEIISYMSSIILITNNGHKEIVVMCDDLYTLYKDILKAKNRKKELMARQDKNDGVCEDYLNPYIANSDFQRISRISIVPHGVLAQGASQGFTIRNSPF